MKTEQIEDNVKYSFALVRSDVLALQNDIMGMRASQRTIMQAVNELSAKIEKIENKKTKKKKYVSSKASNKYHIEECPFAHRIKARNKVVFNDELDAVNESLTACECAA
ncbi:MAG: hypothetical protein ABIJ20_03530 [Nanoarchaeota archaeon]|nr:hypothetical protein [Nanoarchaeota archaeon]MBU1444750.1 hypothetical protein [Nanoarchaeota archaeon]MBU2406559.1 hypothetical protein [Nanoarchaeota archaeon]MBU2420113.1 hypothetical protein [Nanoarchaeota archaeon]MBU2474879.1 hypothetical protein [Nanoarchaeota archaeon]